MDRARRWVLLTGVVLVALVLVACRDEGAGPPPPADAAPTARVAFDAEPEKIPAALRADLAKGLARDVLVLVDDRAVRARAAVDPRGAADPAFRRAAYDRVKAAVLARVAPSDAAERRRYPSLPYLHLDVRSAAALDALDASADVVRVHEDRANEAFLTNSLPLIDQPAAAAAGKTGAGATVVVIDTGVDYTRAAFGSCVAPGPGCKVVHAADIAADDGQLDANGHGTNVAGIVAGVAPGAKIVALDVFNAQNQALSSDVIAAIDWSVTNRNAYGIVAMNLSLGGGSYASSCGNDVFASAIANARAAGILAAVASGNSGTSQAMASPACVPGAVSVGAVYATTYGPLSWVTPCTDASPAADVVTCFSNSTSGLTLLAPGAMITAAGITEGGTSQATPHVAGAIAVLRAAFPLETVGQTVTRLVSTGVPVTDPRQGRVTPRLDLNAAAQGCFLQVAPSPLVVPEVGGPSSLAVTVGNGCAWTATSVAPWLTVTSGDTGSGNGMITVTATTNPGPGARSTTLTVAGVPVTVTQEGDPLPPSKAPPSCSDPASSGYTSGNKTLTIAYAGAIDTLTIAASAGALRVNTETCVTPSGQTITPSMVSRLVVQGTSADETLILDLAGGALASGLASGTGGVVVDLGGGTDALSIRGSSGVDKMTMGTDGGVVYLDATGDGRADVAVRSAEAFRASLGPGADVFSAMGGAVSAVALGGPKTLAPMTASLEVWGGDGDDTIQGGMGADVLHGGEGADTFLAGATADGDDVIQGGPGVDTMSYAARSAAVTVTLDGVAGDGDVAAGESDDVGTDVEDLVGGKGNDVLVGSPGPNFIRGGDGDDTIAGGAAAGCAGVLDELAGDAGDDTFDLGASAACPAKLTGGAGVDTADFSARTNPVRVTLDGKTNDGEGSGAEGLGVDVERVLGGKGDDVLVGSSGADELHGGPGKDALSGGAGDDVLVGDSGDDVLDGGPGSDTFLEGGTDALYTPAEDRGAGSDVINGGTGTDDLVDYAGRVKALSLTICVDPAALAGKSALGSSACTDADGEQGEGDAIVNVTHLRGGDGDDVLEGGAGDDVLEGGAGKDVIHGGAGNDTLYGDDGDDALFGDDGDDLCDGGPGADAIDAGAGDGDVCATDAADTATACEL